MKYWKVKLSFYKILGFKQHSYCYSKYVRAIFECDKAWNKLVG